MNLLIEPLKEGLRVVALAVIPVVIAGLSDGRLDWRLVGITAIVAGLRFVDALLHEWGKENSTKSDESWAVKGLTRF